MKTLLRFVLGFALISAAIGQTKDEAMVPVLRILVITKTAGYRHQAIPTALKTLITIGQEAKWGVTATEDTSLVTPEFLTHFDVVVFLMTTHTIFTDPERSAIEQFVESGKGLVTLHTGADTEYHWPWYNRTLGTRFLGHPPVQPARLIIEDHSNPATACLPEHEWRTSDEWYSFERDPRPDVHVLISIDESTYHVDDNRWFPGAHQRMGDHPLVWTTHSGKGRVFQSAIGHTEEMWADPMYQCFVRGAIEWAGRLK